MSQMKCSWVAWAMDELDLTRSRRIDNVEIDAKTGARIEIGVMADPTQNKSEGFETCRSC